MSEIFWNSFMVTMSGIILALIAVAYKSKCRQINCCCGLLAIDRDVEAEEKIDEIEVQHNPEH